MPRSSRIDAPGALHHIMARGLEGVDLFGTDTDREDFLARLGSVLTGTGTACMAWCLIPDHVHLVLKTGTAPVSTVMRRLLTGYAVGFNRRRRRGGPLFRNRFKSVLCQEDRYLLQLVRFVHRHPLRAGQVEDLDELDRHPYCGHGVLLGNTARPWQETERILAMFGDNNSSARRAYRAFIERGADRERTQELTGGGLIRSHGGWTRVKALRRRNVFPPSDERILGDGDFVEAVLSRAAEVVDPRTARAMEGMTLERVAARVAELWDMDESEVWSQGRQRRRVEARSVLCYRAVRELGYTMTDLARRLGLSVPAVSKSVLRGETLLKERDQRPREGATGQASTDPPTGSLRNQVLPEGSAKP